MSDTSQGPGWWLASDGKWYPPELASSPPPPPQRGSVALPSTLPVTTNKGRRLKHPIATPFALLSLSIGIVCLVVNKLAFGIHRTRPTPLGIIALCLLVIAVLTPLWVVIFRYLHRCYREVVDCVRVVRRGVLSPIQVREEFIATMGREPTIQEVHDLHEMIKSEYNQALLNAGLVAGVFYLGFRTFHHGHAHQGGNSSTSNALNNVVASQKGQYWRAK